LRLDQFGAVNALFDRMAERGEDSISLHKLEQRISH
jgi:hypothetical protein